METKPFTFSELQAIRSSLWNHKHSKYFDYRLVDLIHLAMSHCSELGIEI